MRKITLDNNELIFTFIASPGPGGQNVNKVATGVVLRFNVKRSPSLPEDVRERLLLLLGSKVTTLGDVVIKATRFRTQQRNKEDAIERLHTFITKALVPPKKRKKTKPTNASVQKRLQKKKLHSQTKSLRRKKPKDDFH